MANRKISDLTALTTPASGDYLPIVDISEAADADKNKRITIEELMRGAPNGTAAAPGIAFEGSGNGIYSPGADQVALATGGTGRLFVDASGRVGVGTTSPGAILHTVNTSAGAATVGAFIQNSSLITGTEVRLGFAPNSNLVSDNRYSWIAGVNDTGSNGSSLTFATTPGGQGATEKMRIDGSGRVGIGTTSPGDSLQINKNATNASNAGLTFKSADSNESLLSIGVSTSLGKACITSTQNGTGTVLPIAFVVGSSSTDERMRLDSSGRLLVGTSSDSGGALLQVNGDRIRVGTAKTPASATDTGTAGEICWDANYVYVCTATNTWKRSALSTW